MCKSISKKKKVKVVQKGPVILASVLKFFYVIAFIVFIEHSQWSYSVGYFGRGQGTMNTQMFMFNWT